ncbi:actin nucleation-promoting factor WAS-like [Pteronotus mesoamericanus]|uniref:actin nucleation-promoting factor WAS-like n=1 Tax=Pteronotus mesoamericanus TaxID=1884717 RepID=UPI0023EB1EBF|nr:actin nucleation-promoting factor WAS-like [Pteronotus parnellii mesoamericanus]
MFMGHLRAAGGTPRRQGEAGMPRLHHSSNGGGGGGGGGGNNNSQAAATAAAASAVDPSAAEKSPPPSRSRARPRPRPVPPPPGAKKGVPPALRPQRPSTRRSETPAPSSNAEDCFLKPCTRLAPKHS